MVKKGGIRGLWLKLEVIRDLWLKIEVFVEKSRFFWKMGFSWDFGQEIGKK